MSFGFFAASGFEVSVFITVIVQCSDAKLHTGQQS